MTNKSARQLKANELKKTCSPEALDSEILTQEPVLIGQERAVRSVEFGLRVSSPGYNIFMTGAAGTGKRTFARQAAERKSKEQSTPVDWCYVYNFDEHESPWALSLPAGKGREFKQDMQELIEDARTAIRTEIDGGDFEKQRARLIDEYQKNTNETIRELEEEVREYGFALQRRTGGFVPVPLNDAGTPMDNDEFNALPSDKREEIEERMTEVQPLIRQTMRKVRQLEKEVKAKIRKMEREVGSFAIRPLIEQLQEKYQSSSRVCSYLQTVHDDIIDHLDYFKEKDNDDSQNPFAAMQQKDDSESKLDRYKVNLIVDNAETEGAPVVEETNPTYYNLFGKIEYKSKMGTLQTDHTMIRSGALHRANGGYLILRAEDVLTNPFSWDTLKRSLKNACLNIENIGEHYRLAPTSAVKPEPISLNVKILIIGSPFIYYLLSKYDDDFRKLFKIRADFDIQMNRNEHYLKQYTQFVKNVSERDDLLEFDETATARIIDHSSRMAQDQKKLSARFNEVVEILYEADAWARYEDAEIISSEHVQTAIDEKRYRSQLVEDHIRESIERGKILVDTENEVVGQINGLSVVNLGDHSFGQPSRITANTYLGTEGVVNIERQVKMSGTSHSKAVLIISGYLADQFAYDKPLSLSASVAFEQSYGKIDGDSASCAELYAIISSLADVPLKQEIAVTGSVNQKGEIQPVGGINEKIEGFYYTCKAKGLNGEQGVIIPQKNIDNLMVDDEIIEAVNEGKFNVWTITDVKEGLELMTDLPGGERDKERKFPKDSVYGKADRQLLQMAKTLRKFGQDNDEDNE